MGKGSPAIWRNLSHMKQKTYVELLEDSLPTKKHNMYMVWKKFALNAIERGMLVLSQISKFIVLDDSIKVLDVGCGEGGISIAFAKKGVEQYGIDIDSERIERIKVRVKEENVKVTLLVADALKMPFISDYFDVVICNDVIEHVPSSEHLIEEIDRVLKPNGYLYLQAPNRISPYQFIKDCHYGLFGITLLPRNISKYYVTEIRKKSKTYDVYYFPTYRYLKKVFTDKYNYDFMDCSRIRYTNINGINYFLITQFYSLIKFLLPTLTFICRKRE